jgi:hypothetical protein
MGLDATLTQILTQPTPDALWNLRADLLALSERLPSGRREEAAWSLESAAR